MKNNPPSLTSYEEVLHLLYTNERSPFMKHLDASFDNVFTSLANIHFLGIQTNSSENDLYDTVIWWLLERKLVRKLFEHENWKESSISVAFVKKLLGELKAKQKSITRKSVSKCSDLSHVLSEQEIFLAILRWARKEEAPSRPISAARKRSNSFNLKEKYTLGDVFSFVDFTLIPKDELFSLLEDHISDSENEDQEFSISQETMTEAIRIAWAQYEPPRTKKLKWVQNLSLMFKKTSHY